MPQILLPISDITTATWSVIGAANFYDALSMAGDGEYIESASTPSSANPCECLLGAAIDPLDNTNHTLYFRYQKNASSGEIIDLNVILVQGTTVITTVSNPDISNGFVNGSYTLSVGEAANITDYSNLRVRFTAQAAGGSPARTAQISHAYLEVPDAPSANTFARFLTKTSVIQDHRIISKINTQIYSKITTWPDKQIPLYIIGDSDTTRSLNLFLHAGYFLDWANKIPLFMAGPTTLGQSGTYNALNLFLEAISGNRPTAFLPLYTLGPSIGSTNKSMTLFCGVDANVSKSLDLFLKNSYLLVESGVSLYIRGSGVNAGYFPYNRNLDLWIQRPTGNAIPLYLLAPGTSINSGINLYAGGAVLSTSGIPLVIPNVTGSQTNNVVLYSHGY